MTPPPDAPSPSPAGTVAGGAAPIHGARQLAQVSIDSYSLEIEDDDGLLGDQASQTAFRELLAKWRERLAADADAAAGEDEPVEEMSRRALDRVAEEGDTPAAQAVDLAVAEFADRMAYVIGRFVRQPAWRGVERIVIGGGFKQSAIGRRAIAQVQRHLTTAGLQVPLQPLHHAADDGGLVGWVHVASADHASPSRALLAVDIGGTNVRCGIVDIDTRSTGRAVEARVVKRELWCHADDATPTRDEVVSGIVSSLERLIAYADQHSLPLSPFVGVACPGLIGADGTIKRGTQNLPGDWDGEHFHLPERLRAALPAVGGAPPLVLMHNDAVVQGLSELPYVRDVRKWAVLTVGTGLGNASYTNRV